MIIENICAGLIIDTLIDHCSRVDIQNDRIELNHDIL